MWKIAMFIVLSFSFISCNVSIETDSSFPYYIEVESTGEIKSAMKQYTQSKEHGEDIARMIFDNLNPAETTLD